MAKRGRRRDDSHRGTGRILSGSHPSPTKPQWVPCDQSAYTVLSSCSEAKCAIARGLTKPGQLQTGLCSLLWLEVTFYPFSTYATQSQDWRTELQSVHFFPDP